MDSDQDLEEKDPYLVQARRLAALQKTDPLRAFEELKALAPRSINGMLLLGWAYQKGLGTTVDAGQAETWYRRAAEKGSSGGFFYLGNHYLGTKAYAQAHEAFAAGAAMGHAASQDALRRLEEWQRRESELGPVRHAYELLKTDPARALEQLRDLAANGLAQAMFYLGWAYQKGLGSAIDLDLAEVWYRRAYEKGSGQTKKDAAYYLGHLYYQRGHGDQERRDYEKARERFAAGAALGYAPALFRLGRMYARGLGTDRKPDEALKLFERAAALGNLPAKRDLAKLYLSGHFGISNVVKGLRLFLQSAREIYAASNNPSSDRFRG